MFDNVMSIERGAPRRPLVVEPVSLDAEDDEEGLDWEEIFEEEAKGALFFNSSYFLLGLRDARCTTFLGFRLSSRAIYEPVRIFRDPKLVSVESFMFKSI